MKLRDILSDKLYEFFNQAGEVEPSMRGINLVADYILEYSDYPDEMWEDPKDAKLIAKACVTADTDDFVKMVQAIRRNAQHHAKLLIADEEDYLIGLYYEQHEQRAEPDDGYEKMVLDTILKSHADYMANLK